MKGHSKSDAIWDPFVGSFAILGGTPPFLSMFLLWAYALSKQSICGCKQYAVM